MFQTSLYDKRPKKHRILLHKRMWRYRLMYLMLLPAMTAMILFHYVPLYGIQIAFKKFVSVQGIWGSQWVGLRYFIRMFKEYTFLNVLKNTLWISFFEIVYKLSVRCIICTHS